MRFIVVVLLLLCGSRYSYAQINLSTALGATGSQKEATDGVKSLSDKSLHLLQKRYDKLNSSVQKQSQKMLSRMQKKEDKLARELRRKDSMKAANLFGESNGKYDELKAKLKLPLDSTKAFPLKEYLPGVDSMQTAMNFLKSQNINLTTDKLQAITKASSKLQGLQDKLQTASDVETFIKERERHLKEQLQNSGLAKQLKSINKEAFYYSQRLREYKEALKSPEKIEQKVLGAVRQSHLFQSFMQKHSYLAKLFPTPDNYGTSAALAGLQTRASVQQNLQQRFGISSFDATSSATSATTGGSNNYLQQQMSAAQTQLSSLKDKMSKLGINGGSSDMMMPDFKPNSQHTKSFLQRIEYGMNLQSEKSHSIVPTTSDVAFTAGYKINDKSTLGIGASYKMGWGNQGIKHIKMSSEGVGLRSYIDIKAKGSFWLSGGYEMNYMQFFQKYEQLNDLSAWQRSGLIGITKKYKVGKRENNIQLLWDFLSYQQIPRTPALKFRVGFEL